MSFHKTSTVLIQSLTIQHAFDELINEEKNIYNCVDKLQTNEYSCQKHDLQMTHSEFMDD